MDDLAHDEIAMARKWLEDRGLDPGGIQVTISAKRTPSGIKVVVGARVGREWRSAGWWLVRGAMDTATDRQIEATAAAVWHQLYDRKFGSS
jgi:hypothetical protein